MKKQLILLTTMLLGCLSTNAQTESAPKSAAGKGAASDAVVRTIFAYGGQINKAFLSYIISLTGKPNPKVCFLPTATGDSPNYIAYWYGLCTDMPLRPYVQKTFINSSPDQKSFEEMLLDMDAIVVGGGNTLNMLAIWKAQGIDTVLRKAYEHGILLAGGSAGSLCWFSSGYTDSRPKALSKIEGLGYIKASHCPHYNTEASRKPLYHNSILSGDQTAGYACDELSGIVFQNEKFVRAVSAHADHHSYFVSVVNGKIEEKKLEAETIGQ